MVRSLAFAAALLFSSSALACPMADAAAFTEAAAKVEQASGKKATFAVTGMHCGSRRHGLALAPQGSNRCGRRPI